jgi:hypothetical protein
MFPVILPSVARAIKPGKGETPMTNTPELNDALDDIFGAPSGEVRVEPIRAPADYKPRDFSEPCPKCRGTGRYNGRSSHGSHCFECKCAGKMVFKTSPEARAKARISTAARKAKRAEEEARERAAAAEAYRVANPDVAQWLDSAGDFGFAIAMREALARWGSLTDGQAAACRRSIEGRAKAQEARAAREAAAPAADTAGVDRLKLAFDTAIAKARAKGRGLKMPRITIGGVVITPAKETSTNAGALYVKEAGQYLGKIKGGRFFGVRECSADQEKRVLAFIADPKAAAIAYGLETGVCCICNAVLTNKSSIEAGIGPICASNMGW